MHGQTEIQKEKGQTDTGTVKAEERERDRKTIHIYSKREDSRENEDRGEVK